MAYSVKHQTKPIKQNYFHSTPLDKLLVGRNSQGGDESIRIRHLASEDEQGYDLTFNAIHLFTP